MADYNKPGVITARKDLAKLEVREEPETGEQNLEDSVSDHVLDRKLNRKLAKDQFNNSFNYGLVSMLPIKPGNARRIIEDYDVSNPSNSKFGEVCGKALGVAAYYGVPVGFAILGYVAATN
jgi:hypothetical protein